MLQGTAVSRCSLTQTFADWSSASWFSALGASAWVANLGASGRTYADLTSYNTLNLKGFTTTATYAAPSTYTIAYDADGGSGALPSAGSYAQCGTPYVVEANAGLVNTGLVFSGWSTGSGGTGVIYQPGDALTTASNVTLFANWVASVPDEDTSSLPPVPPPWLQAYQRPGPTSACMDGWNPSWALWPENGTGGYTCERTELWSRPLGTWTMNPGFSW
jgi:hypothetical protein